MTTETPETPAAEAAPAAAPAPITGSAWGVGRRKSATARARVSAGTGKLTINGRALDVHFLDVRDRTDAMRALDAAGASRFDVIVSVKGGGTTGQAGAVCLATARALTKMDEGLSVSLRQQGLVTRDARVKERKKYGRRGARRGFQFSKR